MLTDNLELRFWGQHMHDVGEDSNHDNAIAVALNYHFHELKTVVAEAPAPAPAAAEMKPQPESVTSGEVVIETVELLVEFDTDNTSPGLFTRSSSTGSRGSCRSTRRCCLP